MRWQSTSAASYVVGLLTVASLAVGIAVAVQLQVRSGMGVAYTDPANLREVVPLLSIAEILKICVGAMLFVVGQRTSRLMQQSNTGPVLAKIAATLLIAAGGLGLAALWGLNEGAVGGPTLGKGVAWLGLLSLPVTGLWAAYVTWTPHIPNWVRWLALSLAVLGILALVLPPLGMLFGLLSILFWFAFASAARRVEGLTA